MYFPKATSSEEISAIWLKTSKILKVTGISHSRAVNLPFFTRKPFLTRPEKLPLSPISPCSSCIKKALSALCIIVSSGTVPAFTSWHQNELGIYLCPAVLDSSGPRGKCNKTPFLISVTALAFFPLTVF